MCGDATNPTGCSMLPWSAIDFTLPDAPVPCVSGFYISGISTSGAFDCQDTITSTSQIATTQCVQIGSLIAGSASCICRHVTDKLFADINCNGVQDAGENYIDNANTDAFTDIYAGGILVQVTTTPDFDLEDFTVTPGDDFSPITINRNVADGICGLDAGGLVPTAQLANVCAVACLTPTPTPTPTPTTRACPSWQFLQAIAADGTFTCGPVPTATP
jgi:hypothetical protein